MKHFTSILLLLVATSSHAATPDSRVIQEFITSYGHGPYVIVDAHGDASLPDDLLEYIASQDGMTIIRREVWPQELQDFKWSRKRYEAQLIENFNGDNRPDYALLIRTSPKEISVIVFTTEDSGYSHHRLITKIERKQDEIYLQLPTFEKGKIPDELGIVIYFQGDFDSWWGWNGSEFERAVVD